MTDHMSNNKIKICLKVDLPGARLEPIINLSNEKERDAFRNLLQVMSETNHWAKQLLEVYEEDFQSLSEEQK